MRNYSALLVLVAVFLFSSCEPERVVIESGTAGFDGHHVGYSWAGEANGVPFEESGAFIETILELDEDANILTARVRYWQLVDGYWTTRQSGNAHVTVDFSRTPTPATVGTNYQAGQSMFSIYTANQMSFWAVAVADDGTVAATIVEPLTRYRFEMKFPGDFDFRTEMSELTLGSGLVVPTVRTAGGAWLTPGSWEDLENRHLFELHRYSYVMNDTGVFSEVDGRSSVRAFLQAMGVEFAGDTPISMDPEYGYFGIGGWRGNYEQIERYLVGRNARSVDSLVDWVPDRFNSAINEQNQFGVDVPTGATRTVQNSVDGIAGATVRMSRESTSYQRALVDAGILNESDVIIGRF
ncbi:MAG: hypothetical protein EA383_04565 [Spirochaetaceae bacterium]|nr:MAG: hypothetical protein EA383_04565 [Spirochaetaceae bacterium]